MAKLISGKEVSAQIRQKIKEEAQALREPSRFLASIFNLSYLRAVFNASSAPLISRTLALSRPIL